MNSRGTLCLRLSKALRVSQRHLQRLKEQGDGPPRTRLGERRIAYPRAGLVAWINERTSTAEGRITEHPVGASADVALVR